MLDVIHQKKPHVGKEGRTSYGRHHYKHSIEEGERRLKGRSKAMWNTVTVFVSKCQKIIKAQRKNLFNLWILRPNPVCVLWQFNLHSYSTCKLYRELLTAYFAMIILFHTYLIISFQLHSLLFNFENSQYVSMFIDGNIFQSICTN